VKDKMMNVEFDYQQALAELGLTEASFDEYMKTGDELSAGV
jgi:hypothetical protein